ncbi:glycosyl transferase family 28 [Labrys okinawensis]|uniref:Glycosyl transferase family 28 n=1 Tax=Labrys okinawensis TaxID=346911 RepID=A0A2S9QHD8_9HYPH|nr:glycosyltransferase [Labrys okinawensis]PRH88758.1 glycosyl transferase family 28 [Labrys okinawensis]
MSRSVLILVTHLLGVGHLARAAALARGLVAAGHRVTLVSGGRPAPLIRVEGATFVQLPPVHCVGVDFRTLLGADGKEIGDDVRQARIEAILAALASADPDVVVTETYPFGRRQLAAEFRALLEAARDRPRPVAILSSIRDILNPPAKPSRVEETEAVLVRFYDGVLVHGDAVVTPLSASWPTSPGLERILTYTGYIADTAEPVKGVPSGEILVSGGGSAASLPLYRASIEAAALADTPARWRLLVGHGVTEADFEALAANAGPRVIVERARPDFPALLAGAAASVSQAGYNTMIDLARAGVPAVVVPFEQGKEAEQRLRAECFHALGLAGIVGEADLSGPALAAAVKAALARTPGEAPVLALDGIAASVRAVEAAAQRAEELTQAWTRLDEALAARREIRLWWRDDDAVAATPALDRLLALAHRHALPLSLAVIPAAASPSLAGAIAEERHVDVLVHGYAHANHAPPGAKKQELGHRAVAEMLAELGRGLSTLRSRFGERCLPVLVPPWNRIDPALIGGLAALGFCGLSVAGPRLAARLHDLTAVNIHVDPIAWKQGGGLLDPVLVLSQCIRALEHDEPLGILTHHLVHDAWIWSFLDRLFERLKKHANIRFMPACALFA